MLLSGVISMGIGGPAPDCFIFKVYFRRWYIYWRGRGYVWWYAPRQYILRHEGGSIISGDFSDEETCQSEPQPPRSAPAYGLLTVCFMPLYTWLDVYRHRIPTDRFLSFLFTLRLVRNLLPVSMKVATWSIVPLLLLPSSRAASPLVFASLSSISFEIKKALGSYFRSNEEYPRCYASVGLPRIWVTIQLQAVEGSRPAAFFESTAFLNISETFSFFLPTDAYLHDCKSSFY